MAIAIAKGTILSIVQGSPATYDETGYAALTYAVAGSISGMSDFGGTSTITTFIPMDTGIVDKVVGSTDYGDLAITFGQDTVDAGQLALKAGFDGADKGLEFAVKIEIPVAGGTTVTKYSSGKVSSFTYSLSDANAVVGNGCTIALTHQVI